MPKRSGLGKERGTWKAQAEDPGCRKDSRSRGKSWRSESCVETNARDAEGPWPVKPKTGTREQRISGNLPALLCDCPEEATTSLGRREVRTSGT